MIQKLAGMIEWIRNFRKPEMRVEENQMTQEKYENQISMEEVEAQYLRNIAIERSMDELKEEEDGIAKYVSDYNRFERFSDGDEELIADFNDELSGKKNNDPN
jgi:hypothetical protein